MKIQELLSDESKWTKGVLSLDKDGNEIDLNSLDAVSWCEVGAIYRCYSLDSSSILKRVSEYLHSKFNTDIVTFNNFNATFADIQRMNKELDI